MIDRRQCLALIALGATSAHADAGDPSQVPLLSSAPLGEGVAPGWVHQRLPKVERANDYAIEADDNRRVLHVRSASSASSWVTRLDVDPARTPWLQWQWKVSRSLAGSDLRVKPGDDYAARLYVFFDLPLERLSLKDRLSIRRHARFPARRSPRLPFATSGATRSLRAPRAGTPTPTACAWSFSTARTATPAAGARMRATCDATGPRLSRGRCRTSAAWASAPTPTTPPTRSMPGSATCASPPLHEAPRAARRRPRASRRAEGPGRATARRLAGAAGDAVQAPDLFGHAAGLGRGPLCDRRMRDRARCVGGARTCRAQR